MENLEGYFPKGAEGSFGRILNQDLFFFLLDLEVKRARRYQNFICLMLLKIKPFSKEDDGGGLKTCCQTLGDLLTEDIRESDIIGSLELNKLAVLLPYADVKAGNYVQSRFEEALRYCDFKSRGFEVVIDKICFPINGTGSMDIIRKVLGAEQA